MDVMQVIKERRSIRKIRPESFDEEILRTILEAARWAPSWANTQCWRLVLVRDSETKSKLAETLRGVNPGKRNPSADAIREAPVVIAACAEKGVSGFYKSDDKQSQPSTDKGDWWFMFDLALALQNLTLAAHSLGLGTVHVGLFDSAEVARILNIPDHIAIVELMPLGWPAEQPSPRPRKEMSEFVFYEKYPNKQVR